MLNHCKSAAAATALLALCASRPAFGHKIDHHAEPSARRVSKRTFVEERVKAFEAARPTCSVKLQFIQKADLYTSARVRRATARHSTSSGLSPMKSISRSAVISSCSMASSI